MEMGKKWLEDERVTSPIFKTCEKHIFLFNN